LLPTYVSGEALDSLPVSGQNRITNDGYIHDGQLSRLRNHLRIWQQDVGRPKSEDSRRILARASWSIGIAKRPRQMMQVPASSFSSRSAPGKPLWDSGVRDALHQAAQAVGCDFRGLGPH
jgi:hypothetical protein